MTLRDAAILTPHFSIVALLKWALNCLVVRPLPARPLCMLPVGLTHAFGMHAQALTQHKGPLAFFKHIVSADNLASLAERSTIA